MNSSCAQSGHGGVFASSVAFWLGVVLIACKSVLLGVPSDWSTEGIVDYARNLGIMAHSDTLFALLFGLAGYLVLQRQRDRSVHWKIALTTMWVVALVSIVYAIVSVQVFAYLRSHLTYPLMYLAGDMKNMRSSLGAFLTPRLVAAMIMVPAMFAGLVWASCKYSRSRTYSTQLRLGSLAIVLLYVGWGHVASVNLPWCDRVDRRVAENPHWVLLRSFMTDLFSDGRPVQLEVDFPLEAVDDFATVAERPAAADQSGKSLHLIGGSAVKPKNVIVYVLESVATHYLNLYGSSYETTPCLNREAANALVFDNFYAHCGVTANSLVAINLGIYPGLTWREYTVEQPGLPGVALAQLVRQRGYRTSYMTSGEIQYVNMDGFLKNRGYDLVCGYEWLSCRELIMSWGVEDRCLVDAALQWIDQQPGTPFYTMLWTQQTHHPYEPSPSVPFIDFFAGLQNKELPPDDYDLGRYLNVVREADRQLGRLFDELRRRGLAEDTIVVVTGDHGEGFGSPHDIYGHGGRVFDEVVKVPLLIWNPTLFGAGQRLDTIGGHIDLNPTLAGLLGISPAVSWQGRSLFDPNRPARAYFYAANDDYLLGVRDGEWKYIYNATIAREQLFDMAHDSTEQVNLADDNPDRCQIMRQRLAAWMHYETNHIARLRATNRP